MRFNGLWTKCYNKKMRAKPLVAFLLLITILSTLTMAKSIPHIRTALDDFMQQPDSLYSYQVIGTVPSDGTPTTTYVINMTSQSWLTSHDILNGRSVWWHFILVVVPNNLNREVKEALMWIIGKHNTDQSPSLSDLDFMRRTAVSSGTIVCELMQVPNQPIVFQVDPKREERSEDGLVALTWRHFLNDTSKPFWIAHLPMTRAAYKALDTIQDFSHKQLGHSIDHFTVLGTSKKGWTTYLLAAVDQKRVTNIAPMVIATLNLTLGLEHLYNSLCQFPESMDSYIEQGITDKLWTKEFALLRDILDPLVYKDRYANIPKLLIYSTGDEFFLPDLSLFGYPYLTGMLLN